MIIILLYIFVLNDTFTFQGYPPLFGIYLFFSLKDVDQWFGSLSRPLSIDYVLCMHVRKKISLHHSVSAFSMITALPANISGFILRKLPVAEEPHDLISALNTGFFNEPGMRPHEPVKSAFKLDHVRDWKSWLESGGKRISGIFGPSAPHWFEFVRRESSLSSSQSSFEQIPNFYLGPH